MRNEEEIVIEENNHQSEKTTTEEESKVKKDEKTRIERIFEIMKKMIWIGVFVLISYQSEFFSQLFVSKISIHSLMICAHVSILFILVILFYLVFFLACLRNQSNFTSNPDLQWLWYLATFLFCFASFCLLVGLWPVYKFATPVILFVVFYGLITIASLF